MLALFLKQDIKTMQGAWDVFANGQEAICEIEFRKIMSILGEGKSIEELNEIYLSVACFCALACLSK